MKQKLVLVISFTLFLVSCEHTPKAKSILNLEEANKLIILEGYPEKEVSVDNATAEQILTDLRELKEVDGPIKYAKVFKFVIQYESGKKDTLVTNGTIFRFNNRYYQSNEDLVLKYKIPNNQRL